MSTPRLLLGRLSLSIAFVCSGFAWLHARPFALADLGEDENASVVGVSANGRVLFGQTIVPEAWPQQIERPLAWRTVDEVWVADVLPANDFERTKAHAVSGDGTVIAGSVAGFLAEEIPLVWTYEDGAWLRSELPLPPAHGARPEFVSADGSVVVGVAASEAEGPLVENIAWAWRRVGGVWSGGMLPDGEKSFDRRALSADGSTLVGACRIEHDDESVSLVPTVWRHDGVAWQLYHLSAPTGETLDGTVMAVSGDGRTAVGVVQTGSGDAGWRAVVWTHPAEGGGWSAKYLPGVGTGPSQPYSISHDGGRVVGEVKKKSAAAPVAALWTRVGEEWGVTTFGAGSGFSRSTVISTDGRLAFRDQSSGRTLHHFASGRNLPLTALVAMLEERPADFARWKFGGYSAVLSAIGHDAEAGAYTLIGSAEVDGSPRPFVIGGYAPFLFGETTRVGDRVEDVVVPDLGEGIYKVTGLPAGLAYNDATRTISGRFSKVGLFTTTILNTANKRKRTVWTLVEPLPSTTVGAFQALLTAGADQTDSYPVARLTLTANAKGAATGTLESDDGTTYRLKGVLAPDEANPGQFALFANYTATERGVVIARKKGSPTATFRLTASLRLDGTVDASLEAVGAGVYATSRGDGALQTQYAGKRPENSAPWGGRYTASLGVAQELAPDDRPVPAGAGFATATVAANGKLSIAGQLADGQKFTATMLPGADGFYRIYASPYKRRASVFTGWLRFEDRGDGSYGVTDDESLDVYWTREAIASSKLYPAGIGPAGLRLRVEPWLKPNDAAPFGVAEGEALALRVESARFDNGEVDNRHDLPRAVRFAPGVKLTPEPGSGGAMSFSVNRATGGVTGTFTLVESDGKTKRRVKFAGVLLPARAGDPEAPILEGYFVEPAPKGAESPLSVSGLIRVER